MRHREGALMECALPLPAGDIGSSPNSFKERGQISSQGQDFIDRLSACHSNLEISFYEHWNRSLPKR